MENNGTKYPNELVNRKWKIKLINQRNKNLKSKINKNKNRKNS